MTLQERTADMLARHGEVVPIKRAAQLLNVSTRTISRMMEDGRLAAACGGKRVDVVSMAEYIQSPAKAKDRVRFAKRREALTASGCRWSV